VSRSRAWFVIAATCLAGAGCNLQSGEPDAPARPSGVPATALWAGGVDGGNFILMSPGKNDGSYPLKVYHDQTGELEFNGAVRLDKPSTSPINVQDGKTFNGWDGDTLHLRDGRSLSPVSKKTSPK
jgi:hypothetical protein